MALAETARKRAAADQPVTYGRFRLMARIGVGGMAEVFRAVVTGPQGFEREVVVKRILPKLSGHAEFKELFIREAKISALLSHPNVVQIYEFGEAEGSYFIAMESVQGVTLRETLSELKRAKRAIPFMVAADIARQVCTGLDYAHTLRAAEGTPLEIVHQDISPTNIMLAYNGTAKILDFGIARAAAFSGDEVKGDDKIAPVRGKVAYLAPEQVDKKPFDRRADIFALGAVLHETLTGERLFSAKNDLERMKQLLAAPVLPPSSVNAAIPRELDRIVMKALELDPARRYQSAASMAADLERTLIAARHSSRDLSKLLHGLFRPSGDPLVVVDDTPPPREPAAAPEPKPIPPTERLLRVRLSAGIGVLGGAVDAENARLIWERRRARAKAAAVVLAIVAAVGAGAAAGHRYLPGLGASALAWVLPSRQQPPPAPEPPAAEATPPSSAPAPAAAVRAPERRPAPVKKHPGKRPK
jgi:serine/threonine protein kinase